jgi:RNA polymerase sigma-70 factor (ECF subfamily)
VDDAALRTRMLAGDERAFDEFFEVNFDRVFRFAVRRTGDPEVAQDVAQATLVTGVRKLHTWRGESALFTWLCAICRRELAAHWKRTSRQPPPGAFDDEPEARALLEQIAAGGDGPERQLERREIARLVQATLDYLPDRYGDLLEWKYLDGCPVAEIAARLRATPKAVESMLTRARQAFRDGFTELSKGTESI